MKLKMVAVFSLIPLVAVCSMSYAQTFSVIHAFTGGVDGSLPEVGVTLKGGALYGTTDAGGGYGWGVVYEATRLGDNWSVLPISYLSISGNAPASRAFFGPDGRLYGTTNIGGIRYGNVYTLTPPVTICRAIFCPWHETEIHNFQGSDGFSPTGDLIWDQQGNICGTTVWGGQHNLGTVFELMPSGNGWTEVPIYSFSGPDGAYPYSGVVMDGNGNLFGTTYNGGANNLGTVYELKYHPGVGWTEIVLYSFQGASDGSAPIAGLVFDNSGNLYGGTAWGGAGQGGTIFELSPSGNTWNFNVIYSLSGPGYADGLSGSLVFDAAGNLYGAASGDGSHQSGLVFKLTKSGNVWNYTELHSFNPVTDGSGPSGVTLDSDGTLYGTAEADVPYAKGTIWMIKP
jgi:uncharacterized repeat protein (TIGR03803 family)